MLANIKQPYDIYILFVKNFKISNNNNYIV